MALPWLGLPSTSIAVFTSEGTPSLASLNPSTNPTQSPPCLNPAPNPAFEASSSSRSRSPVDKVKICLFPSSGSSCWCCCVIQLDLTRQTLRPSRLRVRLVSSPAAQPPSFFLLVPARASSSSVSSGFLAFNHFFSWCFFFDATLINALSSYPLCTL